MYRAAAAVAAAGDGRAKRYKIRSIQLYWTSGTGINNYVHRIEGL